MRIRDWLFPVVWEQIRCVNCGRVVGERRVGVLSDRFLDMIRCVNCGRGSEYRGICGGIK